MPVQSFLSRSFFMLAMLVGSFTSPVFAAPTVEEVAQSVKQDFDRRGEDPQFAFRAHEGYLRLAEAVAGNVVSFGKFHMLSSEAIYFYGTRQTTDSERERIHARGMEIAEVAFKALEKTDLAIAENKELLALSYFFYGAHMGRWAEARGVSSSLKHWPKLRGYMERIIKMGMAHVADYGANRILGRAYYKLPFPLGSNGKSEDYLREAFEKTKGNLSISRNGLNIVFYAELLVATDKKAMARAILSELVQMNPSVYNPARIPETIEEQAMAREMLRKL